MLLKNPNPEHATNSIAMDSRASDVDPMPPGVPDPLDDVFGVEPPTMDSDRDFMAHLDREIPENSPEAHPSDMYRLQQEHTTAGYRDGITFAKASSVQSGFDEGFGLGASIGLKVGRLLGILEGIANALPTSLPLEKEELSNLLADARKDLDLRVVLGESYWNNDGTWKYHVPGELENGDVLFSHVAQAHPLVKQWTALVEIQMRKYGQVEQLPLLQRPDENDQMTVVEAAVRPRMTTVQSQAEAKAPSAALSW